MQYHHEWLLSMQLTWSEVSFINFFFNWVWLNVAFLHLYSNAFSQHWMCWQMLRIQYYHSCASFSWFLYPTYWLKFWRLLESNQTMGSAPGSRHLRKIETSRVFDQLFLLWGRHIYHGWSKSRYKGSSWFYCNFLMWNIPKMDDLQYKPITEQSIILWFVISRFSLTIHHVVVSTSLNDMIRWFRWNMDREM